LHVVVPGAVQESGFQDENLRSNTVETEHGQTSDTPQQGARNESPGPAGGTQPVQSEDTHQHEPSSMVPGFTAETTEETERECPSTYTHFTFLTLGIKINGTFL
jgi:hypothetical protein